MITFDLKGELTAEPRPGQLTNETVNASTRRALDNPNLDPHMRAYYEEQIADRPRSGIDSTGAPYTYLRIVHEGRRFEISVRGKLVEQAITLEPGAQLKLKCELLGEDPHYRLQATRITVIDLIERVA